MNSSEFGNISWYFYVTLAYGFAGASLVFFTLTTRSRFKKAQKALKEEGFSADKSR